MEKFKIIGKDILGRPIKDFRIWIGSVFLGKKLIGIQK